MRLPKIIKTISLIATIVAIVLALFIFLQRGCNVYDRYSELKGLYEGNKAEAEKEKQEAQKVIQELKKEIGEKDKLIALAEDNVIELKKRDEYKTQDLEKLESEVVNLKDNGRIIENLIGQVAIWKQRFSLAQNQLAEKDKIIFSLTEKYDAQLKISIQWEGLYNRQFGLNKILEDRVALADKKISRLSFESKIEKVLITGFIIYVGVNIIG
jgi:septal ring factor EnvC (AmiA/AmiB activator)